MIYRSHGIQSITIFKRFCQIGLTVTYAYQPNPNQFGQLATSWNMARLSHNFHNRSTN